MFTAETLKQIIIEEKRDALKGYSNEEISCALKLVLLYLKEFKMVQTFDEFNVEAFNLSYFCKPSPGHHALLYHVTNTANWQNTKTGKVLMSNGCCLDACLVSCVSGAISYNEKVKQAIESYLTSDMESVNEVV